MKITAKKKITTRNPINCSEKISRKKPPKIAAKKLAMSRGFSAKADSKIKAKIR